MGVETVSLIIASFVNGALGIAALLKNFRSLQCVSFALMAACFFAHDGITVYEHLEETADLSNWHLMAIFLAGPATLWFLREIAPSYQTRINKLLWIYLPLTFLMVVMINFPGWSYFQPFIFITAHLAYFYALSIWLIGLHFARGRVRLTREELRLKYAFWGGVVTLGIYITDLLYVFNLGVPPLGTVVRELYLLFIFQTFIQKELMTLQEVLGKIALFSGIALMLSAIYWFLVSWVGDKRNLFFFNTLIASLLVILLFEPIRNFTTWITRRLFLRRNIRLEDELNALLIDLRGLMEPAELSRRIAMALKRILNVENCSLFVLDREGLVFVRFDSYGKVNFEEECSASDPFIEYMRLRKGRPFILETIENDRDSFYSAQARNFCEDCLDAMRKYEADFVISFLHDSRVVGFCTIKKGETVVLSNEQLRLFLPICRQVAMQLINGEILSVLREKDKLATVGQMAAGLAHEIKNPLGAIKGAAELLSDGKGGEEYLKIIQDETNRLSKVLTDFLDYAKPRQNYPHTSCDPMRVIEHTAEIVLRDSDINVQIESSIKNLAVNVDPDILKQVLLNLMMNAVQATEGVVEKPSIQVNVYEIQSKPPVALARDLPFYKKVWEGWQALATTHQRISLAIEVRDNGCGILPEERERIFTPFYTTKPKGTGLGLSICQRLVEGMGGTLSVRSHKPRGSIFTIHLPISADEVREKSDFKLGFMKTKELPV